MQYLRMLTNSLIAGALVGAYVALLVLQLNPMVRLDSMAVARLMLTWAAFYGVHAAAFFYGLIVLRQLLAVEIRSPGWISLRMLGAFGTIAVVMSAIVTWLNLDGFRSVLGPDAAARMTDGAIVVSLCAAVCMGFATLQSRLHQRPWDRRNSVWTRCSSCRLPDRCIFAARVTPRRRRERPSRRSLLRLSRARAYR